MKYSVYSVVYLFVFFIVSCTEKEESEAISSLTDLEVMSGGETTVLSITSNAFSTPAPNLSSENLERHLEGDLNFEQVFVTAPAEMNGGLGPLFNNNSCISCHVKDGRATPPQSINEISGFLIKLSLGVDEKGVPIPVPGFGNQLQNRAIYNVKKEADLSIDYIEKIIKFIDGTSQSLAQPQYNILNPYIDLPENILISPRIAPPIFGLGLLEAVSEKTLKEMEDINDDNHDGISGKINWVWNEATQNYVIGRFGWKASSENILVQTSAAYHQDMGITSYLHSKENCKGQINCDPVSDDPEIDEEVLKTTAFYCATLGVPQARNIGNEVVLKGKRMFMEANCSGCHIPKLVSGEHSIKEISNQIFYPYTDMLLHDMGDDLADNQPSFSANGKEWRTPPLWGIGLIPLVNGHSRYLHDGRARNLTEAILWHGGEAQQSKEKFLKMTETERKALIKFLESI